MHQLVKDKGIICKDLYVDDMVTGADCEESAIQLQKEIIHILKLGYFELRKWSSNSARLLETIPSEYCQMNSVDFNEPKADYTKVLDLKWEPNKDTLIYTY